MNAYNLSDGARNNLIRSYFSEDGKSLLLFSEMLKSYNIFKRLKSDTNAFFSTPFKKVMQHDFDRLYFFNHGFIFVLLDIIGKPIYLPFY